MSRAYKCDRCGKYGLGVGKMSDFSKRSNSVEGPMVDVTIIFKDTYKASLDLCPTCHGEIDVATEKLVKSLFPEAKP